jgi:hypothetical protein
MSQLARRRGQRDRYTTSLISWSNGLWRAQRRQAHSRRRRGPQGQALRRLVRRRQSKARDIRSLRNGITGSVQARLATSPGGTRILADIEHMGDLPLAARRLRAPSVGAFDLPLADVRENGAEMLVLDDTRLRNLAQLVKRCGRADRAPITDGKPAVRIIDDGNALAAQLALISFGSSSSRKPSATMPRR